MEGTNSVVGVTRSPRLSPLGSEFNDFLFAPVCEARDETPLSVISALARLDLDPWEEAAALAGLAREPAAQRLASLLVRLPDGPSARPDPGTISARLVALLPRPPKTEAPSLGISFHPGSLNGSQLATAILMICLAAFLTVLVLMTSHGQTTQADSARLGEVSGISAQTPTPNSGP
jgi:hypothetical protein